MQFIHVHNHSDYSLLKATSTPGGLASAAREMKMPAIALTDDANLFGACAFYRECIKAGVKPIIGCDFFLAPHSRHQKSTIEDGRQYQRMVLLAKNREGYRNLVMLSSLAYTEGFYYKPRIDQELLQKYHAGLIALSGGFGGEIPQLINRNRVQEAREKADFYAQTFGRDNFYLELTDHGIAGQQQINHSLITISRDMNVQLVAANDTYYLRKDDAEAHDVLLCIGNKRKKNDPGRFRFSSDQFYLKSPEEMWKLFGDYPDALENTLKIYEQCNLEMEFSDPLFPHYEIPDGFDTPDAYLRHISHEGFLRRYENPDQNLRNRLNYELETIIKMGFSNYLLIVWDFICYARDAGIPVGPGRGSGAGSMVAYSLGITDIDPMEYGLLFERFLNPERVSMPDLDIDFCFARRQELIDYVTRKYGSERVGQIITFGTLKPRAVIRDVARVLDFSYDEADHAAKLIPEGLKTTIDSALADEPQLKKLYTADTRYRELIDVSRKLQNLHRHASTHAAGIVIGKEALTRYVPLFRDSRTGAISTQFTMEELEDNGLVKMDILGLKTLTLIQNTLNHISLSNTEFDINAIPGNDPKTFEMLGEGKSLAVFQFESGGMQKILVKARPTCIEDLIALNSLFRPGPMENIGQFIDAKQGRIKITYPHPDLEPILKETYGVIVYQEQVMETVRIIAGFSLGKADILRRAMGKKKEKDMAKMRVEYMEGAAKRGIDEKTAAGIFDLLKPFAGYGFNKSHAAAYSVLAYKTAYLKAHYPAQFMAANLTNESDNNDTFALYLNEIKNMDMDIRPPDINESDKHFTVSLSNTPAQNGTAPPPAAPQTPDTSARNGTAPPPAAQNGGQKERQRIIFGLMGIKGVGSSAVDEILSTRDRPYASLEDFFERIDLRLVNRRALEILAQCGAFNSICP
ncbi:MAG: DNA polymerase III subunit alpha, partial [Salinispira sp.]